MRLASPSIRPALPASTSILARALTSAAVRRSVAAIFAALGIWLGLKLTRKTETVIVREVLVAAPVELLKFKAVFRECFR